VFIDNPTVPTQLEVVLDLLHAIRQKNAPADSVKSLLQPKGLPELTASSNQAALQLNAARELKLMAQDEEGHLRLTYSIRDGKPSAKEAIINAVDRIVLASADVEPWFGRLYGYVISQANDEIPSESPARKDLCTQFNNALPGHIERANQLNDTKLPHYLRWYSYAGMGWRDPSKSFVPDPTERVRRALPKVFDGAQRLDAAPFMSSLALACPELDGGALFMDTATDHYNPADRVCTRALAVALRNLHDEGDIQLDCPKDSQGWSLERGGTVRNQETLHSDRFDRVVLQSTR
jgi:hypothetical protein